MSNSPLSNVLLPAVLASGVVFSTLTVPLALIKSEPVVVELPSLGSYEIPPIEIPPIFDGQHKEVAIPYIGFSIVVSVGAGMMTVEFYRRWQQWKESAITEKESSSQNPNQSVLAIQPEEVEQPEYRPEVSEIDLTPLDNVFNGQFLTVPDAIPEAVNFAVSATEQMVEAEGTIGNQPQLLTVASSQSSLSSVSEADNTLQFDSERILSDVAFGDLSNDSVSDDMSGDYDGSYGLDAVSLTEVFHKSDDGEIQTVDRENFLNSKIIESRHEYQTCRFNVPNLKGRVFGIVVNGEYYRFLRAEKTQQKVNEVLVKVGDRVPPTVVTKTEKGYVIWVMVEVASGGLATVGAAEVIENT